MEYPGIFTKTLPVGINSRAMAVIALNRGKLEGLSTDPLQVLDIMIGFRD